MDEIRFAERKGALNQALFFVGRCEDSAVVVYYYDNIR